MSSFTVSLVNSNTETYGSLPSVAVYVLPSTDSLLIFSVIPIIPPSLKETVYVALPSFSTKFTTGLKAFENTIEVPPFGYRRSANLVYFLATELSALSFLPGFGFSVPGFGFSVPGFSLPGSGFSVSGALASVLPGFRTIFMSYEVFIIFE